MTGKRTLRTDWKPESLDDPTLQNFGRRLVAAIESGGESAENTRKGEET